jgi:large conductance mechanosensitive channel
MEEFKDFINKGDVVVIAVGLVMALYFKAIIDALLNGVINPIIAAIFGKANIVDIGFTVNGVKFSIGEVITAVINFIVVAVILFLIIRAYNFKARAPEAPPEPSPEVTVLKEIRDELRGRARPVLTPGTLQCPDAAASRAPRPERAHARRLRVE